jgi:hypothetical protein
VVLIAGSGGAGGEGGQKKGASPAGVGQAGGQGGSVNLVANNLIMNSPSLSVKSGDGAAFGADNGAKGGAAGQAGAAQLVLNGSLVVNRDATLNLSKGAGQGGALTVTVANDLKIARDKTLTLAIAGDLKKGQDKIAFETLKFNPKATLVTTAQVGDLTSGRFYSVRNLDVITKGCWLTNGVYKPDNTGKKTDFARFDQSDIQPNAVMLTMIDAKHNGQMDLSSFDPVKQQAEYLADPQNKPAFITSKYQTKRLRLGEVILVDRTKGQILNEPQSVLAGSSHYDGSQVNHFAYTAGLRRYYWDVYVDAQNALGVGDKPLVAKNFKTADAARVMTQSALAGSLLAKHVYEEGALRVLEEVEGRVKPGQSSLSLGLSGLTARAKTGSSVQSQSLVGALVLAKKIDLARNRVTVGVFTEFGKSTYDTDSVIADYGRIQGEGDTRSLGAGFFVRNWFSNGTYLEGSARGGWVGNRFQVTRDPWAPIPRVHAYNSETSYLGAQAGIGHKLKLSERGSLTPFAQVLWTRTNPDSFVTKFGDRFSVNRIDSLLTRVGARLTGQLNTFLRAHLAVAVEREFKGKAHGHLFQDSISRPPSLRGDSVYAETGFSFQMPDSPVALDFRAFGRVGRQRDLGGSLGLKVAF